jgi:fatty acyl-CoA reductase
MQMEKSEIAEYYKSKCIFITGATGFLGKCLVEKLLRSCYHLDKIYILVRGKKGLTPHQRLTDIFATCQLYALVRASSPDFMTKLETIEGDLMLPNMGISPEDEQKLIERVHIVFHSAATVRFDEPLKLAVQMNIVGTRQVLALTKRLKRLEAFVHISTAYANCDRTHISECVYNSPVNHDKLCEAVEWCDEDLVKLLTPKVIQLRPNTYTYTKAIAETLVLQECRDNGIPCSIVRPSIVGASWREPFPGWIDNFNGPTALFAAIGKGILRTMLGNWNSTADIIPVDVPVNLMIAVAWSTATHNSNSNKDKDKVVKVYNSTTGQINRLTWGMVEKHSIESLHANPLENIFLVPAGNFTQWRSLKFVRHALYEALPAYCMDAYISLCTKQRPMFVRLQAKLARGVETLEFFTSTQWEFTNDNIWAIQAEMNGEDRRQFNVDVTELSWASYIEQYCLGIKRYLLKEDMTRMVVCRRKLKNLIRIKNAMIFFAVALVAKGLFFRSVTFKQMIFFVLMCAKKLTSIFSNKRAAILSTHI